MKNFRLISTLIIFLASCTEKAAEEQSAFQYPETRKDTTVADDYFGTQVADPYRWLEDDRSPETEAWVKAQNEVTFAYLNTLPEREKLRKRLTELWNYPKYSAPFKEENYYYFYKNDGIQNQSVLYIQKTLAEEPKVFIDPNTFSQDGTTAMSGFDVSKNGQYAAYATSDAGSDWQTIHVMEVATKQMLEDKIDWVKFSGVSWRGDGFYYSRYDTPSEGAEFSGKNEFHKVYYHKLGNAQEEDALVHEDKDHPQRNFYVGTTHDERFLVRNTSESTSGQMFHVRDLSKGENSPWIAIDETVDHEYNVIHSIGDKLLVFTNNDAPMNRLVLIDTKKPDKENWTDILPEKEYLLEGAQVCNGKIVASYLKDVTTKLEVYSLQGELEREIELPGLGVAGFSGHREEATAFYSFVNYTTPPTIYKYDMASGQSEAYIKPEVKFNPQDYETRQVFYPSREGTKIPLMITHKKGIALDGNNPCFLYGYGGFNISITPRFSISNVAFLENGGVYAVANMRGGGEYGEDWHKAGTKQQKQNVFDDFIAAAEYLIKEKYTNPQKLAVHGRSNGGLLIGAVMTQRPDLFKVCLPGVGVLDMLRYHKFTIGWAWATDYGTSEESKEMFEYLLGYSPLHNVRNIAYPATMVTTADHDDRVVPAHSFKFAATLQEHHQGNNPMLIRIDVDAGHGAGKPVAKQIEEAADVWAFVFHNLGMQVK